MTTQDSKLIFTIHEHRAIQNGLHYDLRLEERGVLTSWVLRNKPPTHPGIRRLAIRVEDHSLEYADFQGVIPPGKYGAGQVTVWDHGELLMLETDPHRRFILKGKKLQGEFELAPWKENY